MSWRPVSLVLLPGVFHILLAMAPVPALAQLPPPSKVCRACLDACDSRERPDLVACYKKFPFRKGELACYDEFTKQFNQCMNALSSCKQPRCCGAERELTAAERLARHRFPSCS